MAVEYAGILAAVALMAATLTGAYGQTVTAVFASGTAGVAAVAKAAKAQKVSAAGAKAAYKRAPYKKPRPEVPLRARLDRRDEERRAVRAHAPRAGRREGAGSARDAREQRSSWRSSGSEAISVSAAANA